MDRILAFAVLVLVAPVLRAQMAAEQKSMEFQQIAALFAKRYAFLEWKQTAFGIDGLSIGPWLERVAKTKNDLEYFDICAQYVAAFRDSHTSFLLPSSYQASLGITVDDYGGKILIDSIDPTLAAWQGFRLQVGDQLIGIDGVSPEEAVKAYLPLAGEGNERTARRIAIGFLTKRPQVILPRAFEVGKTATVQVRDRDGQTKTQELNWQTVGAPYTIAGPARSPKVETTAHGAAAAEASAAGRIPPYLANARKAQVLRTGKRMIAGFGAIEPAFAKGLPDTFVKRLGGGKYDGVYSGILKSGEVNIGFLRLPDFSYGTMYDAEDELTYFQDHTDGLIVDVTRNPGGYGCVAEDILSYMTQTGMTSLGNQIRMTWDYLASLQSDLELAREMDADPVEIYELEKLVAASKEAFAKERGMTEPMPLCGYTTDIAPAKDRKGKLLGYTKPVMLLIDDASASAAEVFAAVLQDNGRALLYGMRTVGAGGAVSQYPAGVYSETGASIALSILVRNTTREYDGFPATAYIENVGVHPDKVDDYMVEENLLQSGKPFVDRALASMVEHIQSPPPASTRGWWREGRH
jgi:C-terminal processing protease CtpA/Prc